MAEVIIPTEVATAQGVKKVVQEANPTKLKEQQAKEQLRREMLATMTEMELARERVGQYCVTIGDGSTRAVLLVGPQTLIDHISGIGSDYRSESDITHRVYVFATQDGFRALNYTTDVNNQVVEGLSSTGPLSPEKVAAIKKKSEEWVASGRKQEGEMRSFINRAIDGKLPEEAEPRLKLYESTQSLVIDKRRDPYCYGDTKALQVVTDGSFVMQALSSSIKEVQQGHQSSLDRAAQAVQTAGSVRGAIAK